MKVQLIYFLIGVYKRISLQNTRLISMNGLKPKTVAQSYIEARREGLSIKEMVLAVDNDQGGKEFIDKMNQIVNADLIKADIPKGAKDWNEELKKNGKSHSTCGITSPE